MTRSGARSDSFYTKDLTAAEATRTRDAVARVVHAHAFEWLVGVLNGFLASDVAELSGTPTPEHSEGSTLAKLRFIGPLDVFGSERFETNSFEQLCINFANEKLQLFFLGGVFEAEQGRYVAEGVRWPQVDHMDNQGCIDAIEKNPHGVPRLLDQGAQEAAE